MPATATGYQPQGLCFVIAVNPATGAADRAPPINACPSQAATARNPRPRYAGLGASPSTTYWALLLTFAIVLGAGTHAAVHRRANGEVQ